MYSKVNKQKKTAHHRYIIYYIQDSSIIIVRSATSTVIIHARYEYGKDNIYLYTYIYIYILLTKTDGTGAFMILPGPSRTCELIRISGVPENFCPCDVGVLKLKEL